MKQKKSLRNGVRGKVPRGDGAYWEVSMPTYSIQTFPLGISFEWHHPGAKESVLNTWKNAFLTLKTRTRERPCRGIYS